MRNGLSPGLALLLAMLAGCDAGTPTPAAAPSPASGSNYQARIDALPEGQRNAVMLRAVRDARQDCQAVIGTAPGGLHFGMPGWVARCSDGRDWLVMIRPDGTALVTRREEKPPA